MLVTFFLDSAAKTKREENLTLEELADLIRTTTAPAREALPWLKPARFGAVPNPKTGSGSLRWDGNLLDFNAVVGDYDGEELGVDWACRQLTKHHLHALVYTTPSFTIDKPRWRVICPVSENLPPDKHYQLVSWLNGLFDGKLDRASFALSQSYYFGSVNDNPAHRVEIVGGMRYLDQCDELDKIAIGKPNGAANSQAHAPGEPEAPIEDVASAVEMIPNDNLSWDEWNRIGMATWRATGGSAEGFVAFDRWSAKCPQKYDPEETRFRWDHFYHSPPESIGAGTLFYEAQQAVPDWVQPSRRPNGSAKPNTGEYFMAADAEPRLHGRPLVRGLLEREQLSVVFGRPGSGKTFFVLDVGMRIAAGMDVLGRQPFHGGVIYIAAEAGRSIANRVWAFKQHHGLHGHHIPFAAITSARDLRMRPDSADILHLGEMINEILPKLGCDLVLIIIDTLNRSFGGGDENSSLDMGAFVTTMGRLRDNLHCAVLAVHHSGKDETRGSRGHSSLKGAVDTEIEAIKKMSGTCEIWVRKQRDGPDGHMATSFQLHRIELGHDDDGELVTSCVVLAGPNAKEPLTPQTAKAWMMLEKALLMAVHGTREPPNIAMETWREKCQSGNLADTEDAFRKAFSRARTELVEKKYITITNDRVFRYQEENNRATAA
jgi:hypothetical protein